MVSTRLLGLLSTVLLVVGALAFGEALHRTLVTGEASVTSPLMLVYFVVGLGAILLGYRVRQPVGQQYALGSDEERAPAAGEGSAADPGSDPDPDPTPGGTGEGDDDGFDPAMSPLGDAAPGESARDGRDGGRDGGRGESDGRSRDDA